MRSFYNYCHSNIRKVSPPSGIPITYLGQQPRLTLNPLVPIETITTYIVQVSMGDVPQNSLEFRTIFAAGITLFVFTFMLNNISIWLKKKYQEKYE